MVVCETNKEVLPGEDYRYSVSNQDLKILFVGNSYTFYNKLWDQFEAIAASMGYRVSVDQVTKGGYRLCKMNDPADEYGAQVAQKLAQNPYDVVFLQENSCVPIQAQESFFSAVRELCQKARAIGARSILYQTWGRKAGNTVLTKHGWTPEGMYREIAAAYRAIGEETHTTVSPVGDAFWDVYQNHPEIDLYHEDLTHPSAAGTYLAALCHFATLYRVSPIGVSYVFGVETAEEALILQTAAHKAVFGA